MVGNRSRLFAEHPDWILYDLNGNPVTPWIMDNEPKVWGYQDEEYYVDEECRGLRLFGIFSTFVSGETR